MSATGPWFAAPRTADEGEKDWEVYFYEGEEDGEPLIGGWVCEYVTEANARLIAAAPAMRELLYRCSAPTASLAEEDDRRAALKEARALTRPAVQHFDPRGMMDGFVAGVSTGRATEDQGAPA